MEQSRKQRNPGTSTTLCFAFVPFFFPTFHWSTGSQPARGSGADFNVFFSLYTTSCNGILDLPPLGMLLTGRSLVLQLPLAG